MRWTRHQARRPPDPFDYDLACLTRDLEDVIALYATEFPQFSIGDDRLCRVARQATTESAARRAVR